MDMNQLVMTLTNQTTMRFDALGVAVDGFDEKVDALKATGLSADEAFKWAFIEQAEAQIEKVGSVADTTAGDLMKLEASVANLKDELKRSAAEGFGPIAGKMVDSRNALSQLNDLYDSGSIGLGEYLRTQIALRTPLSDTEAILARLAVVQDTYNVSQERGYDISYRYADTQAQVTTATWDAYQAFGQAASAVDFYGQRAAEAEQASYNHGQALRDEKEAQDATNQSLTIAGQAYSQISTNISSVVDALQEQLDFLTAGGGALLIMAQTARDALDAGNFTGAQEALDAAALGAIDLDLELGKIDATEAEARLTEQLGFPPDEAKRKVAELQESLFALTAGVYSINLDINGNNVTLPPSYGGGGGGGGGGGNGDAPIGYESFSGTAPGQPAGNGGQTIQIYGDFFIQDGGDFLSVLSAMKTNSARNSASARAGSVYVGT
jgi:hypothetical protein